MLLRYITDNDLYKFTTMNAIQKLYPRAIARYEFINRGRTRFPEDFAVELRKEIDNMALLTLSDDEEQFIIKKCYYFDPVFIDLLKGYRFDPSEVNITQDEDTVDVEIEGYWYRAVLWEVPILSIISELYYKMTRKLPVDVESRAALKARQLTSLGAEYSDFGTRRRFSFDVHGRVLKTLVENSGDFIRGTSNVYFANQFNITPIGTHPHEWFMYHGAIFGYRMATAKALDAWVEVYNGNLGIALTDTYTTDVFFNSFSNQHAKLFDGLRWDSGDPIAFIDHALDFYTRHRIDPHSKTIVFSDSLNNERITEIKNYISERIHDVYGIGTYLTNDAGHAPLNMVIKMTGVKHDRNEEFFYPVVKLSDDTGKHTGPEDEIKICKQTLGID